MFLHDLKKLLEHAMLNFDAGVLKHAMPNLDAGALEQFLLHQFLAGLPRVVSRQLRSTGEMMTLGSALELLMVFSDQEQTAIKQTLSSEVQQLKQQIAAPALSTPQQQLCPRIIHCFECGLLEHIQIVETFVE